MGRCSEALDELTKVGVADRVLSFYQTRGGIYLKMNELREAAQDLEQIVRLDPAESLLYMSVMLSEHRLVVNCLFPNQPGPAGHHVEPAAG